MCPVRSVTYVSGRSSVGHRKRLHYVGDWHTHPEMKPDPSGYDSQHQRVICTVKAQFTGLFVDHCRYCRISSWTVRIVEQRPR